MSLLIEQSMFTLTFGTLRLHLIEYRTLLWAKGTEGNTQSGTPLLQVILHQSDTMVKNIRKPLAFQSEFFSNRFLY